MPFLVLSIANEPEVSYERVQDESSLKAKGKVYCFLSNILVRNKKLVF